MIHSIRDVFVENANAKHATQMEAYMKNHFVFFGIKSEHRKSLFKPFQQSIITENHDFVHSLVMDLYNQKERELHYCAIELVEKFHKKHVQENDLDFIKNLICTHSWWDSVDPLAYNVLGNYARKFPNKIPVIIEDFMQSKNIWLQRSCLLFQLKYKDKTNENVLYSLCNELKSSQEFFIQKAIGWTLRQYAKTNPDSVLNFVQKNDLKPLSKREALKHFTN